jgi:hypothetical protein
MISTGGQQSRIQLASFMPSMLPGMSMSVNTIRMSLRLQNADCLVGITGFDRLKSGVPNKSGRHKAQERFIFHHKDNDFCIGGHGPGSCCALDARTPYVSNNITLFGMFPLVVPAASCIVSGIGFQSLG